MTTYAHNTDTDGCPAACTGCGADPALTTWSKQYEAYYCPFCYETNLCRAKTSQELGHETAGALNVLYRLIAERGFHE